MSVNHAAQMPQSLPSFAQAFSNSSLSNITSTSNALPPIQSHSYERARPTHSPPSRHLSRKGSVEQVHNSRKRSREDAPQSTRGLGVLDSHNDIDDIHQSPKAVRIKEEDRDDPVQGPPRSPPQSNEISQDSSLGLGAQPSLKKRRVTVSGAPHALGTSARPSVDQGASATMSPTVTGFPVAEDPVVREQMRPMLTVKQQQKALIEQRRGSAAGVISPAGPSPTAPGSVPSRSPPEDHLSLSKLANLSRIGRHSPSAISGVNVNRCAGNMIASGSQATASSVRPLTPSPMVVPSQQLSTLSSSQTTTELSSKGQQNALAHSLPPPPISFARRRAAQSGGRKKKPADILISPRGAGPSDPLAPVIQSAPPVADPGRFPMAIPRLPLVLSGAQSTRRVASNVPPTPTRFSIQNTAGPSISSTARTAHSPPNASVPIASSLVPPTPSVLHHPGFTGDKSAFLAPFEAFYHVLNDSRQLKTWLSDQLQQSNALAQSLKQQEEKVAEIVEDLVGKRTQVMREEITMLRQRMESLEEALLAVRAEASARGQNAGGYGYPQGPKFPQNGIPPGPEPPSTYRFPAPEQRRPDIVKQVASPGKPQDKEHQQSPPASVEAPRQLSVSATAGHSELVRQHSGDSAQPQGSHSSFSSHSIRGAPGSAKSTLSLRPQPTSERSANIRQPDQRSTSRLYHPSSYGNSNSAIAEGHSSSRGGDNHKNFVSSEEC
ncbi:hypothetical protein PAXRUDRAFT_827149 [Paxillus rubicundulus Ve08.2h10]|uniref:Unplaced genomic scaffold scaffold_227, whole genome shotgun sequence n=1 Tax=Paxillus rubicundulus Ve08.2h10 TaxID=930991 RepID=A0A0D0DYJ5_9AGAM|nr:hypothetical protein PAXRUDRAFT_827149 [Paxillus rubicundulus Ve08.2h10]